MNSAQLLSLLQLSDPTLPIGGFAHSSGLETYVQQRAVHNKATAGAFITNFLSYNLHYTDAAFVSLGWDAATAQDLAALAALDAECEAVKLPREPRMASRKLGLRLLKLFAPLCSEPLLEAHRQRATKGETPGHYGVAFGLVAAVLGVPKEEALTGFYYNAAVGLVTNSVKLVPLGQQDGQELLFALQPLVQSLAARSLHPDRDRIGVSCPGFDIRCMQHEHLYSRLYMS